MQACWSILISADLLEVTNIKVESGVRSASTNPDDSHASACCLSAEVTKTTRPRAPIGSGSVCSPTGSRVYATWRSLRSINSRRNAFCTADE